MQWRTKWRYRAHGDLVVLQIGDVEPVVSMHPVAIGRTRTVWRDAKPQDLFDLIKVEAPLPPSAVVGYVEA